LKRAFLIAFVCLFCLPFVVSAQSRKRTVPKKTTSPAPAVSVRPDAVRVSDHIKNLTKFVYLLGGVAKDIEAVDAAAKKGQVSQQAITQAAQSKTKLVESIANWRVAMDELEIDFRTKPQLQKYALKTRGLGNITATAEDQAKAGQLTQSGQTLLRVIGQLTDVLLEMP